MVSMKSENEVVLVGGIDFTTSTYKVASEFKVTITSPPPLLPVSNIKYR